MRQRFVVSGDGVAGCKGIVDLVIGSTTEIIAQRLALPSGKRLSSLSLCLHPRNIAVVGTKTRKMMVCLIVDVFTLICSDRISNTCNVIKMVFSIDLH